MSNKYQIFISSTYKDLETQRDQVIKAVLEMGHIPVGMEMFSAADEEQWSVIKRQIDQSDYYVVILANRYGSLSPDGTGYTEKEYDYAVEKNIPVLGLVLDNSASWPSQYTDTQHSDVLLLNSFKEKVKKKHVSFWKSTDDLYGKCSIALMKAFITHPREGWVRASQVIDQKMSGELTRLSAENAQLREQLETYKNKASHEEANELKNTANILYTNERPLHIWYKDASNWHEMTEKISLFSIFLATAPEMMIEKSIEDLSRFSAQALGKVDPSKFRNDFPVPSNSVKSWMADFSTLDLVCPSQKKKPVSDKNEYWTLSEKGKNLLNFIRRIQLETPLNHQNDNLKI